MAFVTQLFYSHCLNEDKMEIFGNEGSNLFARVAHASDGQCNAWDCRTELVVFIIYTQSKRYIFK